MAELSTKPYLIRAIHQWCEDSGYRPYLAVLVDERTHVPREFVRNGEIVLNVSAVATNRLQLGNELIEFEARFSGSVRQVSIPIENVSAIYAQETGHGMAFDVPKPLALAPERGTPESGGPKASPTAGSPSPRTGSRPKLVPRPSHAIEAPDTEPHNTSATGAVVAASEPDSAADSGRPPSGPAVAGPATASAPAGSAPALQAVDPSEPAGRAPRVVSPKSRRRGKLAAVPDGSAVAADAPPTDDVAGRPADPGAPAELSGGTEAKPASVPEQSPTGSDSDEPPPSPPGRPQLKRIK